VGASSTPLGGSAMCSGPTLHMYASSAQAENEHPPAAGRRRERDIDQRAEQRTHARGVVPRPLRKRGMLRQQRE
jgi:hypothetical protein